MRIVMIVAQHDFRDDELREPRQALIAAGHTVTLASTAAGTCTGVGGEVEEAELSLHEIDPERFDGVVFIGGTGARSMFDDPDAHRVAVAMSGGAKLVGALCIAPSILARAGVLAGRWATAGPSELRELAAHHALVRRDDVVVDGNLVTSSGPRHAKAFGAALVEVLSPRSARRPDVPVAAPSHGGC